MLLSIAQTCFSRYFRYLSDVGDGRSLVVMFSWAEVSSATSHLPQTEAWGKGNLSSEKPVVPGKAPKFVPEGI